MERLSVLNISNSNRSHALGALLALAFAVPALAQQARIYRDPMGWVEEIAGSVPAAGAMVVKMDIGGVSVHGSGAG